MTTLNSVPSALLTTVDTTGTLNIQTNSVNALAIDTNQNATMNYISAQNTFGFKNRVINGAMSNWQRGTSFSIASGSFVYTTDRWCVISSVTGTSGTVSQSTSVPTGAGNTFPYSIKVQRNSGVTATGAINILQVVESVNMYDLAGQSVTLSFWIKSGANYTGGLINPIVQTGTVADQGSTNFYSWTGTTYPIAGNNVTPTTTWTKYSATGTIPSNALELGITFVPTGFTGTAGADDSYYITGVQLEKGSIATPFDYRDYGRELIMCQRYYITLGGTNYPTIGTGISVSGTNAGIHVLFPVTMRAPPTASYTGSLIITDRTGYDVSVSAITGQSAGLNSSWINFTNASSATAGKVAILAVASSSTGALNLSAEL